MARKIFVTGDRSLPAPFALGAIAVILVKELRADNELTVVTGVNDGVEDAVRAFCAATDVPVEVVENGPAGENGKPDWDARHKPVAAYVDHTFLVHGDPLSSSIGKSLAGALEDDKLTVVS